MLRVALAAPLLDVTVFAQAPRLHSDNTAATAARAIGLLVKSIMLSLHQELGVVIGVVNKHATATAIHSKALSRVVDGYCIVMIMGRDPAQKRECRGKQNLPEKYDK